MLHLVQKFDAGLLSRAQAMTVSRVLDPEALRDTFDAAVRRLTVTKRFELTAVHLAATTATALLPEDDEDNVPAHLTFLGPNHGDTQTLEATCESFSDRVVVRLVDRNTTTIAAKLDVCPTVGGAADLAASKFGVSNVLCALEVQHLDTPLGAAVMESLVEFLGLLDGISQPETPLWWLARDVNPATGRAPVTAKALDLSLEATTACVLGHPPGSMAGGGRQRRQPDPEDCHHGHVAQAPALAAAARVRPIGASRGMRLAICAARSPTPSPPWTPSP